MKKGKLWRNITVQHSDKIDRVWKWRVGRQTVVARCGELKRLIPIWKLTGYTELNGYEHDKHKGTIHVTPKLVADWLFNTNTMSHY